MLRKTLLSAIALSLVAGTAAFAQNAGDRQQGVSKREGARQTMFQRLDRNGDGIISSDEFAGRHLDMLRAADADGDGTLTQDELLTYVINREFQRRAERAARWLDIDGDGTVTLEEIEAHQQKRFALLDRNNDGELSQEELRRGGHGWRAMHEHRRGEHGPRFSMRRGEGKQHRFMHRMKHAETAAPATPAAETAE
ncbi:EF-hand domain-containing protein [Chelativorans sp. Marseille-P2723]|uniref:EF-hand domain-containing protein n=1 Tax=Chelativorans sp. Marseille-P2723 TaxID=2709133 RepID=UPI0015715EA8|nr:EF-hand domain-containing protein [Chelativorans sp. Marseille-P2723]